MKNINLFDLLIYIIIIVSNFLACYNQYSFLLSAVLSLSIVFIFEIWVMKVDSKIKLYNLIFIIVGIFLVLLTQKINLVSLLLIAILNNIASKNGENIELYKYIKISLICFLLTILVYYFLGFNADKDTFIWRITSQSVHFRSSLGYVHPNQAMFRWLAISLALLLCANKNNIVKLSLVVGIITALIYKLTLSRTSVIVICITIGLLFIFRKRLTNKIGGIYKVLLALAPTLFLLSSFSLILLANNEYFNSLFSGRFVLYKRYYEIVGINLFGNQYIENNSMLDNSYLHMILSKGLIFTISYLTYIFVIIRKNQNITIQEGIILLAYFLSGVTETILFKFELVLLIIIILYRDCKIKIKGGNKSNGDRL